MERTDWAEAPMVVCIRRREEQRFLPPIHIGAGAELRSDENGRNEYQKRLYLIAVKTHRSYSFSISASVTTVSIPFLRGKKQHIGSARFPQPAARARAS